MERLFERVLWGSRLLVLIAVVASLLVAVVVFVLVSVEVVQLVSSAGTYLAPSEAGSGFTPAAVAIVVDILDGYLLAAVMVLFALGLYELFVSRIDAAENSEFAARLLLVQSLDDLKERLAKVVVLILIVKFAQFAFKFKYQSPLELLYLAISILLIGGTLYLTGHHLDSSH